METFEIAVKKNRRKTIKRTIVWSTIVVLALGGIYVGVSAVLGHMVNNNMQEVMNYYQNREQIAYPNIHSTGMKMTMVNDFSSLYQAHRAKDLDGVMVPYDDITATAGYNFAKVDHSGDAVTIFGRPDKKNMTAYTGGRNIKVPQLFNIKNKDKDDFTAIPSQELSLVSQMPGQLVEVALTFDKPYSYEELQSMLPDNLKKNWYWLGTYSDYNTASLDVSNLFGLKISKDDTNYSFDIFQSNLKESLNDRHGLIEIDGAKGELYSSKKELDYMNKTYTTFEKCKFSGIILTGKAENFAQLEGKEWIYASSIGASVQNQPYYQLDKE